ncbi:MAG TPA: neprosin family prolyl endopeptidase [Candidatus Methylomirabilis sp.]|nr:neprosin family prolyl endopeptidase [Candidatus Methylomirabilis sp.]
MQTAECGWQVFPGKYGTTQPCLFIYWTADGYQNTGCYNLDCAAFVQTNPAWIFGGTISPASSYGGTQYDLEMGYYLYQGNWWLYLQGTDASHAVGYYPASLYNGGQLASNATDIDYGGEVVDVTAWPPMGSGNFADTGWQFAAYQRDIYYFPPPGGVQSAALTGNQDSANCFTITLGSASDPWNEYFFFGGPGGTDCT